MTSSCSKPDSGITSIAVVFVVSNDTDSCFGSVQSVVICIEPFSVTVVLQGALGTKERFTSVTTQ